LGRSDDAVASFALRAEKALVGDAENSFLGLPVLRIAGDAGADGDDDGMRGRGKIQRSGGNAGAEGFEFAVSGIGAGFGHDDDELFATEAADGIALAEGIAERGAEGAEDAVASGVAVSVVEGLEVIDVNDGDREVFAIAAGAAEFGAEAAIDVTAIEQAGENVGVGKAEEFLAARDDGDAEKAGDGHEDHARDFRRPSENAVGIARERRTVEVPASGGVQDDGEVLADGQEARGDANALVVAETRRADADEVAFEGDLAVDGDERLVEEKKDGKTGGDERGVEGAAEETEPGRGGAAGDEINAARKKKNGKNDSEGDVGLFPVHRRVQVVGQGNEEEDAGSHKTKFGDEEFAGSARGGERGVRARPKRVNESLEARVHGGAAASFPQDLRRAAPARAARRGRMVRESRAPHSG